MRSRFLIAAAAALLVGASIGFLVDRVQPAGPALALSTPVPSTIAVASPTIAPATPSPVATTFPTASVAPDPPVTSATLLGPTLQATLDRLRVLDGIPGASATIIFPDGSTWRGVSGLANVSAGTAVTPDTAFAIGSISKTFLATLILDLAADGRLRLDASARTYVPTLAIDRAITIRQLLDHTSGLYDFFFRPGIDRALRADRSAAWSTARTLKFVGKPYFRPGTGWHYSNTNYFVLGLIAQNAGGATVARQLRDRYLDPLGLSRTFYQVAEKPRGPVVHAYRFAGAKRTLPAIDLADGTGVTPFRSVVTAAGGAGSIAASSYDIARWARDLYTGAVLAPEDLDLMVGDVAATAIYKPRIPYGLGVQAIVVGGYRTLGHSGRLLGSQGAVRYLPDAGLTIAVLTNQSRSDPAKILVELLRIAAPPPPIPPVAPIGSPTGAPSVAPSCVGACPTP